MAAIQKHLSNFSKVRINANEGVLGQRLGPEQRNASGAVSALGNGTSTTGWKKGKSAYTATPGLVDFDKYSPGLYAASRYVTIR